MKGLLRKATGLLRLDTHLNAAFFCDRPFNWDCLASTYAAFHNQARHQLTVLTTSAAVEHYLSSLGVNVAGVADPATIHRIIQQADVLFAAHPHALQPFLLEEDACKVVYIPYGMTISGADYSQAQQHNLWIHNRAWRIIAGSCYHRDLFAAYCTRGAEHVVPLGNPKWDLVSSDGCDVGSGNILWNIHYTIGASRGTKWSTWFDYGTFILEYFKRHPELTLVVRPHPGFFPQARKLGLEGDVRNALAAVPNSVLDETPSPTESILKCSALLTDGSSLIYDFGVTGKPLMYLRTAECEKLHVHAFDLVQTHFAIGDNSDKLQHFLDGALAETAETRKQRREGVFKFLGFDPSRPVGDLIRDYVIANV